MKKSLYICNANTTQRVVGHTDNTAISVFPCGISAPRRCVVFAKLTKEIRSLFVHTKSKTCYTMRTPNKQAMKAKNSKVTKLCRFTKKERRSVASSKATEEVSISSCVHSDTFSRIRSL